MGGSTAVSQNERIFIGREKASPQEQPILVESRTPKQIVADLDMHVIGQTEAKKAVATSLRNRWRRMHVADELKHEITPLNILLIGPTGSGKTEIARRLASMTAAPFVKVEATKYTEVGIVGSSAEECIKELTVTGYKMELTRKRKEIEPQVKQKVETELLSRIPGTSSGTNREKFLERLRDGEFENTLVDVQGFKLKGESPQRVNIPGVGNISLGNIFQNPSSQDNTPAKLPVSEARSLMTEFYSEQAINKAALAKSAIQKVEQSGIVFLDEIDKIAGGRRGSDYASSKGEGVQKELLGIIEGTNVQTELGTVSTEHILFIASGAFHYSSPSDLLPELQGRLPIKVNLKPLTKQDFVEILSQKTASLVEQTKALFKTEDIVLDFTEDGIEEIAQVAADLNKNVENIGARRLRAVVSKITEELSFDAPDYAGQTLTIDGPFVRQKLQGITAKLDLAKYIL